MVTTPTRTNASSGRGRGVRLPDPFDVQSVQAPSDPGVRAPAGAFGIGGLEQAGSELFAIGQEKMEQERRAAARSFEAEARTKATIQANEALLEAEKAGTLSNPGFTENFQKQLQTINESAIEAARQKYQVDDDVVSQVQSNLQLSQVSTLNTAAVRAHNARVGVEIDSISQNINQLTTQVRRNPDFYDDAVDTAFDMLDASRDLLGDETERDIRDAINTNLGVAQVEGLIERNPGETLAALREGVFDDLGIEAGALQTLENRAEREHDRRIAKARSKLNDDMQLSLKLAEATGREIPGVENRIRALEGEDAANDYRQAIDATTAVRGNAEVFAADPEAFRSYVETERPDDPGDLEPEQAEDFLRQQSVFNETVKRTRKLREQLAGDPVGYFLSRDDELRDAYTVLTDNPGDEGAAQAFVDQAKFLQKQAGIPEGDMSVLPGAMAQSLVTQIQNAKPTERVEIIGSLAQTYGEDFPTVSRDLAEAGLGPSAMLIGTLSNDPRAPMLASAVETGKKELKNAIGDDAVANDVEKAVQDEMAEFSATITAADPFGSEGAAFAAAMTDQIETLALSFVAQGDDTGTAARRASEIVLDRYEFVDTYRIPKEFEASSVRGAARTILRNPDRYIDPAPVGEVQDIGLSEEQLQARQFEAIQNDGYFVTSPDESGLILMRNTRVGPVRVQNREGRPIRFSFDALERFSGDIPGLPGLSTNPEETIEPE